MPSWNHSNFSLCSSVNFWSARERTTKTLSLLRVELLDESVGVCCIIVLCELFCVGLACDRSVGNQRACTPDKSSGRKAVKRPPRRLRYNRPVHARLESPLLRKSGSAEHPACLTPQPLHACKAQSDVVRSTYWVLLLHHRELTRLCDILMRRSRLRMNTCIQSEVA